MTDHIHLTALKWARAVRSRSPENVLKLYHPEGSLWGTLAQEYRHGYDPIFDYFIRFLDKEDLQCEFKEGMSRIYNDFAFYSGSYEFSWNVAGKSIVLPARFSFVYKKENNDWLIMEHHSSLFPEQPFRLRKFIRS
jgi:hypothetical protein